MIDFIKIRVIESPIKLAGRPKLLVQGEWRENRSITNFSLPIIGMPEFLGANMFHVFFTASYTSNSGQVPENFSLISDFSKVGAVRARMTIDNTNFSIAGIDESIVINTAVSCDKKQESIWVK